MAATTITKKRLTQEERSASTRNRLLDATIECLIERGYAGTTTTEIATRAGLSRGAQLHHFPTKVELVTKAVEHLANRRIESLRQQATRLPAKSDQVSQAVDLLWSSFSGPLYYAAVELWMAARTDAELRAALYPVERHLGHTIDLMCQELFGELAESARFKDAVHLTIYMMRGMALERILKDDDTRRRELLNYWKQLLTYALEQNKS